MATEFEMLNNLLGNDIETDEDVGNKAITPASFGGPAPTRAQIERLAKPKVYKDPKAIWDADEVDENIDDDINDGRTRPKYEFLYRQAVGTEDAYLGSNDKDPSSTCCEDIVLRVELPGTQKIGDLDLDVQATHVRLESALYKLSMYLPHRVDEEKGAAKWDSKKETLTITLRIIRPDLADQFRGGE